MQTYNCRTSSPAQEVLYEIGSSYVAVSKHSFLEVQLRDDDLRRRAVSCPPRSQFRAAPATVVGQTQIKTATLYDHSHKEALVSTSSETVEVGVTSTTSGLETVTHETSCGRSSEEADLPILELLRRSLGFIRIRRIRVETEEAGKKVFIEVGGLPIYRKRWHHLLAKAACAVLEAAGAKVQTTNGRGALLVRSHITSGEAICVLFLRTRD